MHAHILIWLITKIHANQIDDIICAELPNEVEDSVLYSVILKKMIHGPCGIANRSSPCMQDGKCSKKYPNFFLQDTQTGDDGYPLYRRRKPDDGGFTATKRVGSTNAIIEIDNRLVVPYNSL
jgi:hypothetical protein